MVERVFVSTRPDQTDEPERRRFAQIIDRYSHIGPVAGVLSAMDDYPAVDWLVVACDLPNVDQLTIRHLIDHRAADKPFTAYRSSHDDLPEPLCAIYRSGSEAIVRDFVDAGLTCPRKMLIRSDTKLLAQPNPRALDNINTPEELQESVLESAS
jgi:molybdopterin-guanine dinucleotide biosynthesis protein A